MLDRTVVKEFLNGEFKELEIKIPKGIKKNILVETFCQYVEDDYYEWLNDNLNSFFEYGNPDWDWIRDRISYYDQPRNRQDI